MIELLRDPAWNGIAGIAAIFALLIAIWQEKKFWKGFPKFFVTVGRSLIGILILFWGPFVQSLAIQLFKGGMPQIAYWWHYWNIIGINIVVSVSFLYAAMPGIVTSFIASTGRKRVFLRTAFACIIALTITDFIIMFVNSNGILVGFLEVESFFGSFFSNIIGGSLAGMLIAYLVSLYDNAFESHQP